MSNIKIAIIPIGVLIIIFSLLFIMKTLDLEKEIINGEKIINQYYISKEFFKSDFSKDRVIFLIGSSHIAPINATKINEKINDYKIYNLAESGDTPKKRISQLENIIKTKPEIIFYGISYRDFKFSNADESFLPTVEQIDSCGLEEFFASNPKLITRYFFKNIFNSERLPRTYTQDTPFYGYNPDAVINDSKTFNVIEPTTWKKLCYSEENIKSLEEIILQSQKNNIKIIIFTTPLHVSYLESLNNFQKEEFKQVLEYFVQKYNIKIYEFENRYSKLDIWYNPDHISYQSKNSIYTDDVIKMILEEQ